METKELDTNVNKNDYADICVYIKQIESINLSQLYRALTDYLSCLIIPQAEKNLDIFRQHLADPYSWLNKAQLIAQAAPKREFAKTQSANSLADQALWDDASKKINYLIEGWDADIALTLEQIIQGIRTLINDNIALVDVQDEIIEFAKGRNVIPSGMTLEEAAQKLQHLLHDAWVNSSTVLVKMVRTAVVQADLFLNRITQLGVSFNDLDAKQSFLFESNYKICQFIQQQSQGLKVYINALAEKVAERVAMRLNRISIDTIVQRYQAMMSSEAQAEPVLDVAEARPVAEVFDEAGDEFFEEELVIQPSKIEAQTALPEEQIVKKTEAPVREVEQAVKKSSAHISHEKLEKLFSNNEELIEIVIRQVSLHRIQLSCFSRIKACYGKFSLFPVFRKIASSLSHHHVRLSDSLSELSEVDKNAQLTKAHNERLNAVTQAIENNLERIKTYLATLDVHHQDYSVIEEISNWQTRLHDLILQSSEEELIVIESRLQRIEMMDSPYLRATLVMKLDVTKLKLNDMILANMQSWSFRLVDRETVMHTLDYLGIRIHPMHISKIAPNLHAPKKKNPVKRNFYSTAADYSMNAWRNMRAWLDKRAIN